MRIASRTVLRLEREHLAELALRGQRIADAEIAGVDQVLDLPDQDLDRGIGKMHAALRRATRPASIGTTL